MMSRRARSRAGRVPVAMNTMMMVDVLFILLIFFIVVSEVRTSRVEIDLPEIERREAESTPGDVGPEPLQVTIDATDSVYLEGEAIRSDEELRWRLADRMAPDSGPSPKVLLRADRSSSGARLVQLVDLLSESGFRTIAFDVHEGDLP